MRPGDTDYRVIWIFDADGNAVTGEALGDFTVTARYIDYAGAAASYTHNAALTEIASGAYDFSFSRPANAGFFDLWVTNDNGYNVIENHFFGETENYDYDYLVSKVIRPVARIQDGFTIGTAIPLTMVSDRFQDAISVTIEDTDGNPITLDTTYDNYRLAIRNEAATVIYDYYESGGTWYEKKDAEAPVAMDQDVIEVNDSGVLAITLPEDAQFYEQLTGSTQSLGLYYDVRADKLAVAKTVPIIRSSALNLLRREGPAT